MTQSEASAPGTPGAGPAYTMYLDQSAHLDWDWLQTFEQNYWFYSAAPNSGGVDSILTTALANLKADPRYHYSLCEMGFLRRFVEQHPDKVQELQHSGDRFQALGGGITSPDCLVCSGEGFIRNYLVGQTWLSARLGLTAKPRCWIPDDFGQGPELPVLMAALGFSWVSLWRIPGGDGGTQGLDFLAHGVDFNWKASDGSSVTGHWLPGGYAMGSNVSSEPSSVQAMLASYVLPNAQYPPYPAAQTPYLFAPVGNDFSLPVSHLLDAVDTWNTSGWPATTGVTLLAGTFDQFAAAVDASPTTLRDVAHNGTPYWTGYFASHPALKILHYEAVRSLAAAEIFGLLTQPGNPKLNNLLPQGFWTDIDSAWDEFAPSTHHDYVCGTATDPVYVNDQLPRLRGVAERGRTLRSTALNALAGMVGSNGSVLIANSLGFERTGLAEIGAVADPLQGNGTQRSHEGGTLVRATVPSLGYRAYSAWQPPKPTPPATAATIAPGSEPNTYVLQNEFLIATIDAAGRLLSLTDPGGTVEFLKAGSAGNTLAFYKDQGGLYRFGNELYPSGLSLDPGIQDSGLPVVPGGPPLGGIELETGPLRVRLRATIRIAHGSPFADSPTGYDYTREYALVAGEPFLRMATTGAAPSGYSVMASFPLAEAVAMIDHGTAYHWTKVQPAASTIEGPVFRATHDFLLARAAIAAASEAGSGPAPEGALVGAVYHCGMPAWAIDEGGALIGCLFRNTPQDTMPGAGGTDPAVHTQHYAFRVPTGLDGAETGQPLREALGFTTPLQAVPINAYPSALPATYNLAAAAGAAILTVAKPGSYDPTSLILRLYQPSNSPQTLAVTLSGTPTAAPTLVTATETAWPGGGSVEAAAGGVSVTMENALVTLRLPGLGRLAAAAGAAGDPAAAPPAVPPPPAPDPDHGPFRRLVALLLGLLRGPARR